jgi:hypothetical protein
MANRDFRDPSAIDAEPSGNIVLPVASGDHRLNNAGVLFS